MTKTHRTALNLLSVTIFMLLAVPRMNVKLGPVPFYFIDVMLLLTFLYSTRLPNRGGAFKPNLVFVGIILFFAVVSEIYALTEMLNIVEPLYQIIRTSLAISLFFSTVKIITDHEKLLQVTKAAMLGAIVTSAILMLTSLPPTRGFANAYIMSIKYFEPSYATVIEHYSEYSGAMRGRSYVGVSILSGAFLNSIWPVLLFIGAYTNRVTGIWKTLLLIASIILPVAVVMTYSRGAMLGLILVAIGVIALNVGQFRKKFFMLAGLVVITFLYIGLDSNYFYFKRLENSTKRAIETRGQDENEAERLYAYTEPFEHLVDNPQFLFFGKGLSYRKSGTSFGFRRNYADHAVFAKAYYSYGLIAAFMYVFVVIGGIFASLNIIVNARSQKQSRFSRVVLATLMGFLPWFVLGHAAVSSPRGAMMAFFVFGLITIQKRINHTDMLDQTGQWKEQL